MKLNDYYILMNSEHLNKLLQFTTPIKESFEDAAKQIYLVGGIVRDLHVGVNDISSLDLDFTTDATPEEIKKIIEPIAESIWLSGQRFGTIGAQVNGKTIEITTHRSESYVSESRKPVVTFSNDIHEDLSRRDFTINSMAIDLKTQELIDPFNGLQDLQMRALRTPLDPTISFSEDPLRMMRAARFISRYNLTFDKGLKQSVEELRGRLEIVSAERIRDELNKLLMTPDPNPGFKFLLKTKLYELFLPELLENRNRHQVRYLRQNLSIRLSALLINVSQSAGKARMKELKYPNREIDNVENLISAAKMILTKSMNNVQYRRWYLFAGENRQGSIEIATVQRFSRKRIKSVRRQSRLLDQELKDSTIPLTGSEIINIFGIDEGPKVGNALEHLKNLFIENGPISRSEAIDSLEVWIKSNDI
ncbi:MAG: CCA tRNA nucleotidyltransferase [Acidimicrobiaceae bacterium]|nr:CCA tRNA nucleotidyltransferase [Acidimicrobiaceae bacterium]